MSMILGIDASNLHTGGSTTHLCEVLRAAEPARSGFGKVVVWSGAATLAQLEERAWLVKGHEPLLDGGLASRAFWQRFRLSSIVRRLDCDALWVPGGSFAGDFQPVVTMSRNMLPFEWAEIRRYGASWMFFKLLLLRLTQTRSYRRADGTIFLTRYAYGGVSSVVGTIPGKTKIVPHGVDTRFMMNPRRQRPISEYTLAQPFRMVYVSTIDAYKHHGAVAKAVGLLRNRGLPVSVDFVGGFYAPAYRRLRNVLAQVDPTGAFVHCRGKLPYRDVHSSYAQADLCIFASSCENMPNVLLEGMASGLPIACSDRGPMPEVLGDTGLYFNPEDPDSVAKTLQRLIEAPELREQLAHASSERSREYTWKRCADDTFAFIAEVARASQQAR